MLAGADAPARPFRYLDFKESTFTNLLEKLLGKKKVRVKKEFPGSGIIAQDWSQFLSCVFELRKEALRLCLEDGPRIQSALWAVHEDTEHWVQWVTIAISGRSPDQRHRMDQLQKDNAAMKRLEDVARDVRRSRSLRGKGNSRGKSIWRKLYLSLRAAHPLAFAGDTGAGRGRGKGKKGKGKSTKNNGNI